MGLIHLNTARSCQPLFNNSVTCIAMAPIPQEGKSPLTRTVKHLVNHVLALTEINVIYISDYSTKAFSKTSLNTIVVQ